MTGQDRKILQTIGENLRFYRKRAGYTQEYVRLALHVSQNTICNYECGRRSASSLRMVKMAKLYGCTVADLTEGV